MNKIFALIIITLISAHSGENVRLKIKDRVSREQVILDSALQYIKEIRMFIDKPLNWCSVEPTGEVDVFPTENEKIKKLVVTAELYCDEKIAHEYFESIAIRYKPFLLKYGRLVDQLIKKEYPDLWFQALMMNHTFAVLLKYERNYSGNKLHGQNEKMKLFRMVLNDKFTSPDVKKFQTSGFLIDTHVGPFPAFFETQKFSFLVYTKSLKGSVNVRFEPVYHPTSEEGNSAKTE